MGYEYRYKKGIELKLSRKKLIVLISLFAVVTLFLVYFYFAPQHPPPLTSVKYYNYILNFRADLKQAQNVPIYPEELAVRNEIMHQLVENVTIVFKPASETENALYIVEEFEIITKLLLGYERIRTKPNFNAVNISSYENIAGTIQNPIIVLVHPIYSNETSVSVGFHSIYIKGKTTKDFDLATIKFLMAALDIEI